MAFDANGNFTRIRGNDSWKGDAASPDKRIKSDVHDINDNDLANALSDCLNRRGYGGALANLSMGGFRLMNLPDSTAPQDAATVALVNKFGGSTGFGTPLKLTGADDQGRVNFTSLTGDQGIAWQGADLSWLAKLGEADKTVHRLVLNDKFDGTGEDKIILDDRGHLELNNPTHGAVITHNISWDGDEWRTIVPGFATQLSLANKDTASSLNLSGLDAATTLDAYKPAALRTFFTAMNSGGTALLQLRKSASGKAAYIMGLTGTEARWLMYLGDTTAESGTAYVGSNFVLNGYDNAGLNARTYLHINRDTRAVTVYGDTTISGTDSDLTVGGKITQGGDPVASVYNGAATGNLDFPIGSVVMAWHTADIDRNANAVVALSTTNSSQYKIGSNPPYNLLGTWRARGSINPISGAWFHLMQRMA